MRRARYLSPDELAPKPDPATGVPRPPRGPRFGKRDKDPRLDPDRETDPAQEPAPPPGQGPVLAWYRENRRSRLLTGGGTVLLMVVIFTIGTGLSIDWMQYWWAWLLILVGAVLVAGAQKRVQPSAGVEWFQQWGGGWVRTYELTKVTAMSWPTGIAVTMTDRDGRRVNVTAFDLVEDPLIMDLVYNGIMHSVIAGGAETNGALHAALNVPYPKPADRRLPGETRAPSPAAARRHPRGKRRTGHQRDRSRRES